MATLQELEDSIAATQWFARMGHAQASATVLPVRDLRSFANGGPWEEFSLLPPSMQITWLPTTRDQGDPFWGDALSDAARTAGRVDDLRDNALRVYSLALSRLRGIEDNALFNVDDQSLAESARGAALHAVRNRAREITMERDGEWNRLCALFFGGFFPLAVLGDGRAVVF